MLETQVPNRFSIFHRGPSKGPDFEAWREGICRGFCRLDVGPAEQDYIDCHNEFAQVNSIAVATPKGGSARFARTRDLLTDGCDDLVLISATRGTVHVTQKNKAIDLTAGQMCLTEMNVVRLRRPDPQRRLHYRAISAAAAAAGRTISGDATGAAARARSNPQHDDRPLFPALSRRRRRSGQSGPEGGGAAPDRSCRAFARDAQRAEQSGRPG